MAWIKIWNRKHTLQKDYLGRFIYFLDNPYYKIKNMMTVSVGHNKADCYIWEADWQRFVNALAKEIFKKGFLEGAKRKFQIYRHAFRQLAVAVSQPKELRTLTNRDLLKRYEALKRGYKHYTYFFWTPWAANEKVVPWFERQLRKKFPLENDDIFRAVTSPVKLNIMEKQRLELLRYKIRGIFGKKIAHHAKKYGWLGVYSLLDKPLKERFFMNQVSDIRNPSRALFEVKDKILKNQQSLTWALNKLRRYPVLYRIAIILSEYAWLRTERVDVWREILWLTQAFYRELDRRMGLRPFQSAHMTYEEIVRFLDQGIVPDKSQLHGGETLYFRHGKLRIIRDKKEIKKVLYRELRSNLSQRYTHLQGMVACRGQVRGIVKIVMVPEDCKKMKKGQVLVSNMTHPDYIFGIKKAAAIVTDEGGISSHAAIVAREMNIPCIIGTKIATQVLKDGDRVEVDATKGVVKKIYV